jgi:hypothetical protein
MSVKARADCVLRSLWTTPANQRRPVAPEFGEALDAVTLPPEFSDEVQRMTNQRTKAYRLPRRRIRNR